MSIITASLSICDKPEYAGKTQLNMGHLVDSSRQQRGEGFELRTDKWGAIRANNGIFISADGRQKASSTALDMIEATGQLSAALNQAKQLKDAADASKATGLDTLNLMSLIEGAITMLQQASVLISAPAGIAQTTPSSIQHNAGRNVITTAGKDVSLNAKNNVTMAASEEVSIFAHNKDLRAVAGYGKVELQAQTNQMNLDAKQDIQITSHDGKLTLYSPKEINLVCGKNSFIHMNPDQIIINAPDHIIERTAVVQKQSPGSMPLAIPPLPEPIGNYDEMFVVKNKKGEPLPHFKYKLVTGDGQTIRGVTNEKGETARIETSTNKIKIDVYEDDDDDDQSFVSE